MENPLMPVPPYDYVLERCIQLVAKARRMPPESITAESSFEGLGVDSLDLINLSFEVEERFNVEIPDDALSSIRTVGDMARGVLVLLEAKAGAEPQRESA
jgi:acyl carrier protein